MLVSLQPGDPRKHSHKMRRTMEGHFGMGRQLVAFGLLLAALAQVGVSMPFGLFARNNQNSTTVSSLDVANVTTTTTQPPVVRESSTAARPTSDYVDDNTPLHQLLDLIQRSEAETHVISAQTLVEPQTPPTTTGRGRQPPDDAQEVPAEVDQLVEQPSQESLATVPTTLETTTLDPRLYADSPDAFHEVLESIKRESLERDTHPANYVTDDEELAFIIRRLDESGDNVIESRVYRWEKGLPMVYQVADCPICREDMEPGRDVHKTTCNHQFHTACLERYAASIRTYHYACPICRTKQQKSGLNQNL